MTPAAAVPGAPASSVTRREVVQPEPAVALARLLGVEEVADPDAAGLPLLWHWLYTLERPAQSELGPDGHPVRGAIPAPPGPGRRRMWAGGSVLTWGRLRTGAEVVRQSSVESVRDTDGRAGRLTFVAVRHRFSQGGAVVVDERQDIVYRDAVAAPPSPAPVEEGAGKPVAAEPDEWAVDVTPTLLFRFSALTYNAHRIHYDRDYATGVEGYPGLVTHGPLQALCMAEAARRRGMVPDGAAVRFDYRLTSPLFDHQGLVLRATREPDSSVTTAARDVHGRLTARGALVVGSP